MHIPLKGSGVLLLWLVWQDAAGFGIRPLIHDVLAKNPMHVDIVIKDKIV